MPEITNVILILDRPVTLKIFQELNKLSSCSVIIVLNNFIKVSIRMFKKCLEITHFLYLFSKCSFSARVNAEWTRFSQLCSLNEASNDDIIITLFIYCKLPAYPIKKAFKFL